MKRLFKKIILFWLIFLIVSFVSFLFQSKNPHYSINYFKPQISQRFTSKIIEFNNYIVNHDSVNLFLGSSQIEAGVNPDLFHDNWFSFSNDKQNIYNSYIFLNHYINLISIDTVIISLHPFDFPSSYLENRNDNLPFTNNDFMFFVKDSITNLFYDQFFKRTLENLKQHIYFNIDSFIENKSVKQNNSSNSSSNISVQHRSLPIVNLDSLYEVKPNYSYWAKKYFFNVNKLANFNYFKLFDELCSKNNIKVFYILMPKSKYYHANLEKINAHLVWENIKDSLEFYTDNIYDYENWRLDSQLGLFYDTVHLSSLGAEMFVKYLNSKVR